MQFPYQIPGLGGRGSPEISEWNADKLLALRQPHQEQMRAIISAMGEGSRIAQGLGAVLTDWARITSTSQRLYVSAAQRPEGGGCEVFGILKTGEKKLFLRDEACAMKEYQPVCVLDFYVNEGRQRMGIGLKLFQAFLAHEQVDPRDLAYDRPSPKLKAFLARHFQLTQAIPQSNNFLVFREFFASADRGGAAPTHDAGSQKRTMSTWERPLTAQKKKQPHARAHHHQDHAQPATILERSSGAIGAMGGMLPAGAGIPVAHVQVDAAPRALPSGSAPSPAYAPPWGLSEPTHSQALRGPSNGGADVPSPGGAGGVPPAGAMASLPPLRSRSGSGAGFGTLGGGGGGSGGSSGQYEPGVRVPSEDAGYVGHAAMNGHPDGAASAGGYASIRNPSPQRLLEEASQERERPWLNRSPSLQPLPPLSGMVGLRGGSPGAGQRAIGAHSGSQSPIVDQQRSSPDARNAVASVPSPHVTGRLHSFGQNAVGLGLQGATPRVAPQRLGSWKGDASPKGFSASKGPGVAGPVGLGGANRAGPPGSTARRPESLVSVPAQVQPTHFQQMPPLQWARR